MKCHFFFKSTLFSTVYLSFFFVGFLFISAQAAPPAGDWTLVLSDEFDGPSLDTSLWGYGEKPWGTTDNSPCLIRPEDTYLENGNLVLRSDMGDFGSYNFTSGWAWTKVWKTYGYMEIRAQYPAGKGQWPAWWMLRDGWPPEFDIAEFRGASGPANDYMTQAFCWYDNGNQWDSTHTPGDYTVWHTYGFEWGPGYLKWYINDQLTKVHIGEFVPSDDMYVILSAGLDSNADATTGFPNYFVVDYFRWYQKEFPGPPAAPSDLTALLTSNGIYLDWNGPADWDMNHYNVYSSTVSGGPYTLINSSVTATEYIDTGLPNNTMYYYVVTAVDNDGNESVDSNEASESTITFYPITVENYSFEYPREDKVKGWNGEGNDGTPAIDIPGWASDGSAADSGIERASTTLRRRRGFLMGSDPSVWQITSEPIVAGKTYLLEADMWDTTAGTTATISMFYVNDFDEKVELALEEYNINGLGSSDAANGTVVYTVDDGPVDAIGRTIGIMIDNNASGWIGVDNVRLSGNYPIEPIAPTGLTAAAVNGSVWLDWADNGESDLASYTVYRSTTSSSWGYSLIASGVERSAYIDDTVTKGTTYYYRVTAVDTVGNESDDSNVAIAPEYQGDLTIDGRVDLEDFAELSSGWQISYDMASLLDVANDWLSYSVYSIELADPNGLAATADNGTVLLDWLDNGEPGLASYTVYRSTTSGSGYDSIVAGVATSDYIDDTVANGTTYYYVITAVDTSSNESGYSNEAFAPEYQGDLTIDGRVDLEDLAELSSGWQTSYDMASLLDVANDWLEGTN